MVEWVLILGWLLSRWVLPGEKGFGGIVEVVGDAVILGNTLIILFLGYITSKLFKKRSYSLEILFYTGLMVLVWVLFSWTNYMNMMNSMYPDSHFSIFKFFTNP